MNASVDRSEIERLDATRVPCEVHGLRSRVVETEGEHTSEVLYEIDAVFFVQLQENFGIRPRSAFEFFRTAEFLVIVDFAIEDDDDRARVIPHWLITVGSWIEDRKTSMSERYAVTCVHSVAIRPTVNECLCHAINTRCVFADESCDATHEVSILDCTFLGVTSLFFRYDSSSMVTVQYSIVIPALNEEGAIGPLIDQLRSLPSSPEIIVVNDGSTDGTLRIAQEKGVRVLSHPIPAGYGRSAKDGMMIAIHDTIVAIDADGTYPVLSIPPLLAEFDRGFDMVVGARHGKEYRGTFLKMPARIILKWLVEFTTGRKIPDINSGLRVFRRSDALPYVDHLCNGFSFLTTITLIYMLSGKFVGYMPIEYYARIGHSKVRIIRDSLRTLQYITEVIALYNPLKLYVLLSLFLIFFALLGLIASFVLDIGFLLFASLFFIGAVIVFATGVHAHIQASLARPRSTSRHDASNL